MYCTGGSWDTIRALKHFSEVIVRTGCVLIFFFCSLHSDCHPRPRSFPYKPTIYLALLQIRYGPINILKPMFVNVVNESPISVYHKHGSASRCDEALKFAATGSKPGLDVHNRADGMQWNGKHQPLACGGRENEGRLQEKHHHSLKWIMRQKCFSEKIRVCPNERD